ncbi:MAG: hypothetical protein HC827_14680 [Cyanobacteria bacterium RM1_2_2]|nr:hypothetical protein [Cyanobacteria bacterium RM1_2_2]
MALLVKPTVMVLGSVLWISACNGSSAPPTTAVSPAQTPQAATPTLTPPASPSPTSAAEASEAEENVLISPKGIGAAQLGMTLGELKQRLGSEVEFIVESPFIVDFDALAVRKDGEVQYYILYLAGQSFSDQDVIQGLLTDNPKFQTAEKIGSSSTIREAEQVYGPVTLSYNTQNESREYARFANQPAGNISFATGSGNAESAGIYASPLGAYNETQQFKDAATIQSVLVVCLTEDCVPPTNP